MDRIRTKVQMDDPTFVPGSTKTAAVTLTVIPAALGVGVEVWLGLTSAIKTVTSGLQAFLSTGSAQTRNVTVTMPTAPGTYQVFVDVIYTTVIIAAYIATDTVIIPSAAVSSITWA